MLEIRPEAPEDIAAIRQIHQAAFGQRPEEARLVELLRQAGQATITLVAVLESQIVGHILFSPITIVPPPPTRLRGLGLAPIGVLPTFQRQGIGSQLINRGLQEAQRSGDDVVVVLGDPRYYSRFGFIAAQTYHLDNEYNAHEEFMVLELRAGALSGISGLVKYQPEFKEVGC